MSGVEIMPAKPRLLVLASTYPRWAGDPEPGFVHELSKRLVSSFEVTVLCPHAPGARTHEQLDGVEVVRYRYAPARWETLVNDGGIVTNLKRSPWKWLLVPGFMGLQALWAWRLMCQRRIDVVHAHWLIPQGLIAALLRGRAPFLVTSHGADLYALRGGAVVALKRWVLAQASAATVVSDAMRNSIGLQKTDLRKVSVMPMGVDLTERFTPNALISRSRDEILFVGRLVEKKGVAHLVRAMPTILSSHPSAYLSIAGFGPDEGRLRALAAELGLAHKVHFLGALPQRELPALYQRAAIFVAPFVQAQSGDQEGLGLVLVEAMGCGCPVVVGDVPAVRDVLGPSADQALVNPEDEGALAKRVLHTLADPERAQARAQERIAHVRERFDWARVAEGYARLLSTLT